MPHRRRSARSKKLPQLTPEIVADDEQLAAATDEVMLSDPGLKRMSLGIVRAQRRLLDHLGEHRDVYLVVEERTNQRMERLCTVLGRWAFNEGVRVGRGR